MVLVAPHVPSAAYLTLLAQFPEERQGVGLEPFWDGAPLEQPMTYAIVLSSETLRYRSSPNAESERRIRKALSWLVDNADLDRDGTPGWGLPDPWDAFSDGSVNPANQVYTITTSIVMNSLLDALHIRSLWAPSEREPARQAIRAALLKWCRDVWSDTPEGGFFWYSPRLVDAQFVPNVSAMFMGTAVRVLREDPDLLAPEESELVREKIRRAVNALVAAVSIRGGLPFWDYIVGSGDPNDLLHHVYTLWGLELYRIGGDGKVRLPWQTADAVRSLDTFWVGREIREYPQDVNYSGGQARYGEMPAELWGAGAMLALYARWGERESASRVLTTVVQSYGNFPLMARWPLAYFNDPRFFARFGAHVLWGIAVLDFSAHQ